MKRITAIAAFAWTLCGAAFAQQQPNPIIQHYRAYQAALEANDLARAEVEAAAAYAVSEAREGNGGRTGVLALNLAILRLARDDAAGALAPARRALALAEQRGEDSGVPLTLARMVAARTELASGDATAGARLAAALDAAQQERLATEEIFDAAVQLANHSYAAENFSQARQAWTIAANYAEGSRFPEGFALARARIGQAASMLFEDVNSQPRARFTPETAETAYQYLFEAQNLLRPLAHVESASGAMTIAQRTYAEALAWSALMRAKLNSDGQEIPVVGDAQGDADGLVELQTGGGPMALTTPRCLVRFHNLDGIRFPGDAWRYGSIAGVAYRVGLSETGEVEEARAVAVIGRPEFGNAVDRGIRDLRVTRHEDSPANCRMPRVLLGTVQFTAGSGGLSASGVGTARRRN